MSEIVKRSIRFLVVTYSKRVKRKIYSISYGDVVQKIYLKMKMHYIGNLSRINH